MCLLHPGTVAASYTLSLANCSAGIAPVEAQRLALQPNTSTQIAPFQVGAPYAAPVARAGPGMRVRFGSPLAIVPGSCGRPARACRCSPLPVLPARTQVYVEDSAAKEDRYCWLMLYDSQGRVSDKARVRGGSNLHHEGG